MVSKMENYKCVLAVKLKWKTEIIVLVYIYSFHFIPARKLTNVIKDIKFFQQLGDF